MTERLRFWLNYRTDHYRVKLQVQNGKASDYIADDPSAGLSSEQIVQMFGTPYRVECFEWRDVERFGHLERTKDFLITGSDDCGEDWLYHNPPMRVTLTGGKCFVYPTVLASKISVQHALFVDARLHCDALSAGTNQSTPIGKSKCFMVTALEKSLVSQLT